MDCSGEAGELVVEGVAAMFVKLGVALFGEAKERFWSCDLR